MKGKKIFVAGHSGMVGTALVRSLERRRSYSIAGGSFPEYDFRSPAVCEALLDRERPEVVICAAARVGGIQANIDHPAEFIYDNLAIQNNLIHLSYKFQVKRLCFLSSSCVYPRECPQPMREEHILQGPFEPTNEGYAIAKVAGMKMVECYQRQYGFDGFSVIPCNLYGTNDHFDLKNAHVLSALVRKFVDATLRGDAVVEVWGTGRARREFMHVDDAAEAIIFLIERYKEARPINVGWGVDISIKELAEKVARAVGFDGRVEWNTSKPDGMMRKCMDVSRLQVLGFSPRIGLEDGIKKTIEEYKESLSDTSVL